MAAKLEETHYREQKRQKVRDGMQKSLGQFEPWTLKTEDPEKPLYLDELSSFF